MITILYFKLATTMMMVALEVHVDNHLIQQHFMLVLLLTLLQTHSRCCNYRTAHQ